MIAPFHLPESLETFRDRIGREFCEGSAIDPGLFEAAIDFIEDSGFWEPNRALGQEVHTQWQTRQPHSYGAIAAFLQEAGGYWQGKPANPRTIKGKVAKYEAVIGNGNAAYFPPLPLETRQAIASRWGVALPEVGSVWRAIEAAPSIPLILTEGGKKSLSALSYGYAAIGLYGCDCLRSPDLIPFLKDRTVLIGLDSEADPKKARRVRRAIDRSVRWLESHGARVFVLEWAPDLGKGIDDLIVGHGIQAFDAVIAAARPFRPDLNAIAMDRARRSLASSLREADIRLDCPELPIDYWQAIQADIALSSGLGTGKSNGIGALIRSLPSSASVTALTHRVALGGNLAERWGLDLVNHLDSAGGQLFNSLTGKPSDGRRVAACVDSIELTPEAPDLLLLDEVSKELRHLLIGGTTRKNRPKLLAAFCARLRAAGRVVMADADLTDREIAFIEAVRGKRPTLIRNDYRHPMMATLLDCPDETGAIAKAMELLQAGRRTLILCSQKSTAIAVDSLISEFIAPGDRLLIHGDNSGDPERQAFLRDPNGYLQAAGLKALIASPTMAEGVSIEVDAFDAMVSISHASSIDDASIAQFIRRDRHDIPRWLWIQRGNGRKPRTYPELINVERTIASFTLKATGFDSASMPLDWESAAAGLAYHYRATREWSLANLRAATLARLEWQGYTVETVDTPPDLAIRDRLKAIAQERRDAYCHSVASAEQITPVEAGAIERRIKQGRATEADQLALARFKLESFYLAPASPELVRKDGRSTLAKAITVLEDIACPDLSLEGDAARLRAMLEQGGEILGGDLPLRHARVFAVQALGLDAFLIELFKGAEYRETDPAVQSIASKARHCAAQIRALFGFLPREEMRSTEIVGRFLRALGLKTHSRQVRSEVGRIRVYCLDFDASTTTIETIARRHENRSEQGIETRHTTLLDLILTGWCDTPRTEGDRPIGRRQPAPPPTQKSPPHSEPIAS